VPLIWLDDVKEGDRDHVGGKVYVLARLRQAGFPVPDGFVLPAQAPFGVAERALVASAYEKMSGAAAAVRSSSIAEDGAEASFAGQYVTVLDVRGEAAIAEAVATCRARTARAEAYARALGIAGDQVAVLVQRFVEPRAAGVVFTRDPQDADSMIVEAHAGRGEAVVSGTVRPARYRIARATGAVQDGAGDVLSAADLRQIVTMAWRIEQHLAGAQDIEWAWGEEGLVILQARPITVLAEEGRDPRIARLTRANVGEVLPGPVTPLTWSVLGAFLEHAFRHETARIGVLPDDAPAFLVLYRRRLYLNLDVCIDVAMRMPGVSAADAEKLVLGAGAVGERPVSPPLHRRLNTLLRIAGLARSLPAEIAMAERTVAGLLEAGRPRTTPALIQMLAALGAAGRSVAATHVNTSGASAVAMAVLERLLARDGTGDARERTARLLAGLDGVESVAPATALETIAAHSRAIDEQRRWLDRDEATISADYAAGRVPAGLREELALFFRRFGHRGLSEGDVSARSWEEDPSSVFASLRRLLATPRSPGFGMRARAEIRMADEEALAARAGLAGRAVLGWAIAGAQTWVRRREHTKSLAVSMVREARRLVQMAAADLVERGALLSPELVDFLSIEEIRAALQGAPLSMPELRRRRRRHLAEAPLPAAREVNLQAESAPTTELAASNDGERRGIGVSAGVAVGRARVATEELPTELLPGEILIAPVLDAALAPLLATAGGAVVEIGGILSHGSVVAREMGVPCVVDVRDATRTIRTGEMVMVDGSSGRVCVLPEASSEASALAASAAVRAVDDTAVGLHPLEDNPQARESVYFNMCDPQSGAAIVFSMAVRHGGKGEALLTLSLPDGRVLFGLALGRATIDAEGFAVGGYRLRWRPLRLEIDASVAAHENASFPPAPIPLLLTPRTSHITGALDFTPTTAAVDFCESVSAEVREWLRPLGSHHVEQSGRWRGSLLVDGRPVAFDGRGARDHSWGLRDWEAADYWRLFMAPINDRVAAHAVILSVQGRLVSGGFLWRDGATEVVTRVEYAASRDGRGRVDGFELELTTSSGVARLRGNVERTVSIPVQPERRLWRHLRGRPYRLVLHENFTRYEMAGEVGYGMAEFTERPR
jgi:phosphohistidine swiveling domain-containing protein